MPHLEAAGHSLSYEWIEGETATSVLATAKRLYSRAKGEKMQLEVIYPRRRGPFLELVQSAVELKLR